MQGIIKEKMGERHFALIGTHHTFTSTRMWILYSQNQVRQNIALTEQLLAYIPAPNSERPCVQTGGNPPW